VKEGSILRITKIARVKTFCCVKILGGEVYLHNSIILEVCDEDIACFLVFVHKTIWEFFVGFGSDLEHIFFSHAKCKTPYDLPWQNDKIR
jgi:hypothetical protein